MICELAGADSITVHLREDRRHIKDRDVELLRKIIKTKLNLEMAATDEMTDIAIRVKPDYVCLVPEKRQELTTEGGLDVYGQKNQIAAVVNKLKNNGIWVSIFVDPDEKQISSVSETGADCIELHTGGYAQSYNNNGLGKINLELGKLNSAALLAAKLGLIINAGHGLDYRNVKRVAKISGMNELNIGFSIISKSVFVGIESAVREMKSIIM